MGIKKKTGQDYESSIYLSTFYVQDFSLGTSWQYKQEHSKTSCEQKPWHRAVSP